jgi:WD40 repeat protein
MLSEGSRVGPYHVVSSLGAGGMGEVWRAHDPRLGRDVALKVLAARFADDPVRLARLRAEAKVLASLNHPHIAALYGLEEADNLPVLVMELVEGETLSKRLWRDRLPLAEALELGRQIAEGLEAAHEKGILHRDLKPANVRLTEKGRAKLLDFGLARMTEAGSEPGDLALSQHQTETSPVTGPGQVLGTPSYMSPEQARGEEVDRRTDVWAFGCVLFEILTGQMAFAGDSFAETVTAVLAGEPRWEELPDSTPAPVVALLKRCLKKAREERLRDVGDARLELEEVLQAWRTGARLPARTEGRSPYPGLRSFTEKDAAGFFGREEAVKELWKKLQERRLTAVIGPSGVGKTSFLRAGICASRPAGWGTLVCSPGSRPFRSLANALAGSLAGDAEGVADLIHAEDPGRMVSAVGRWRRQHAEALLVVDQLEELFTQAPPEMGALFAEHLGQLAKEGDVHVLLSIRDDFVFECSAHPGLRAVFSDLFPLRPPEGDALRRLLVEPAAREGVRFEDEALVDAVLSEVAGERGALPLLAFAASRLWEHRDREKGLLTRDAYTRIGGVAGAVAQHADATLETIGAKGEPIVRELFRNLVTAQGTRAARDRDELLSVFGEGRGEAARILDALVAARLLTEYETPGSTAGGREGSEGEVGADGGRRVEIIHESLLTAWPRLVRWRTQDEEGAQLRDQLRQAARAWRERGQPQDLLWSGTSYREFELWRERYPGSLTANEESFAEAMTRHAERLRRRRRMMLAGAFLVLVLILAVVLGLWRRSEQARQKAVAAARRADASRLVMLGRLQMDEDPTAALADLPAAREEVMAALWRGSTRFALSKAGTQDAIFSPDGRWLARWQGGPPELLEVWPSDGGAPVSFPGEGKATFRTTPDGGLVMASLSPHEGGPTDILLRAPPDWSVRHRLSQRAWLEFPPEVLDSPTLGFARIEPPGLRLFEWPLDGGAPLPVGVVRHDQVVLVTIVPDPTGAGMAFLGRDGRTYVSLRDGEGRVSLRAVGEEHAPGREEMLAKPFDHPLGFDRQGRRLAVAEADGSIGIYAIPPRPGPPLRTLAPPPAPIESFDFSPDGRWLASESAEERGAFLWDLTPPAEAEPIALRVGETVQGNAARFDPSSRWLVLAANGLALLPLPPRHPHVIRRHEGRGTAVAFDPRGRFLVSAYMGNPNGSVRLWSLLDDGGRSSRLLFKDEGGGGVVDVDVDPAGENVLVGCQWGRVWVVPLDGSKPRLLQDSGGGGLMAVAFGPKGRRAAATGGRGDARGRVIRVWDLKAGGVKVLDAGDGFLMGWWLEFTRDGHVLSSGRNGTVRVWDVETGAYEALPRGGEGKVPAPGTGPDTLTSIMTRGRLASTACDGRPDDRAHWWCHDLVSGRSWPLDVTAWGDTANEFALDPSGRILVSGDTLGNVRVGPVDGGPPHLLVGHEEPIEDLTVSADGHWIASTDSLGTLRIWPMPEGEPFHRLPREELISRLHAVTNVRVVEDARSSTGYRLTSDPFPGWAAVPTW